MDPYLQDYASQCRLAMATSLNIPQVDVNSTDKNIVHEAIQRNILIILILTFISLFYFSNNNLIQNIPKSILHFFPFFIFVIFRKDKSIQPIQ